MREISKATGINLGNLYNYIDSKEDILCLVFSSFHAPAYEWFKQSGILDIDDPEEQLRKIVRKLLEIIHHYKNDVLMMYRETNVLPSKFMKIVLGKESALIQIFEEIIKKGVEKQAFRVKDPFFSANMLVFQLSLDPLRSWNLRKYTQEELMDLTEDSILGTILRR
jgi:AcrR family transcriptional regulator